MRKSDVAVFAIFDLIYLFATCVLASGLAFLVLWGVNLFVPISYAVRAVIHTVVVFAASVGLGAFFAYRDGYRYTNFSWGSSALSAGIAAMVHYTLGLALRFLPFCFGPVRNAAGLFSFGEFYTAERVEKIPFGALAAVGAVMMLVYVGAFVLANRAGCANRLRDCAEIVDGQSASK